MSLPAFSESRSLSVGVELELQIVNTHDFNLAAQSVDLLRQMRGLSLPGDVKPEMTQSMIEMSTGICVDHADTLSQIGEIHDALLQAARKLELALCGGGTHPFQHWAKRRIFDSSRFAYLSDLYGYLAKQFTVFGQHVHIGCTGPDQALMLLHGLSRYIPHIIALSSSSPFVQGVDTGFDSARLNSVFAFPLSGRAPYVLTWSDFETYFSKMTKTGVVQSMKDFYWDIRPKPEYGTIEVRVLDTPLTIRKAAALAAFIQCLARWIRIERPFELAEDDYLVYTFNRFQACRFGVEGHYVHPTTGEHCMLRDDLLALFALLEVHAMELKAEDALLLLRGEMLTHGNDAGWLRNQYASDPVLSELVRQQTLRWSES